MFRVYACITQQHDIRLVLLAAIICLLASYTSFNLVGRARSLGDGWRFAWLGAAAFVAGSGVFATHFVAMLAFRPGLPVGYDFGLTALSALVAIAMAGVGFLLAWQPGGAALGGAVLGAGVGAMHFMGMAALRISAVKHWDGAYAAAALAIGIGIGALAMAMAARARGWRQRLTAAAMLALAICGMHFTAMAAFSLELDPLIGFPDTMMAPEWLAVALAVVTLLIIALGLTGAIVDEHIAGRSAREAERLRRHVAELEAARRELEATTDRLQAALEAAAAGSQAKSQFLATMSHELRTPLNAVIGFAEMQASEIFGPLGDPRYKEYAGHIVSSGQHLLGLINDVLDFSKLDVGRLELDESEVGVQEIIADCVRMVQRQADTERIRLLVEAPAALPPLRADRRRLRQILLNLLSNAIKFTPEGGEVRLSVRSAERGLLIVVADSGIGMAPADIPVALERFGQIDSRLSRSYEGAGLGLPLAKRLAELHGGALEIESAPGLGTTVTLVFPPERIVERRRSAA